MNKIVIVLILALLGACFASELRMVPCSSVCARKTEQKACLIECSRRQREISQKWLNGNYCAKNCPVGKYKECVMKGQQVCRKTETTRNVPATMSESEMVFMSCDRHCEMSRNKPRCMTRCKEDQKRVRKSWNRDVRQHVQSDSELSLMRCDKVCEQKVKKGEIVERGVTRCMKACKESQKEALRKWNLMSKCTKLCPSRAKAVECRKSGLKVCTGKVQHKPVPLADSSLSLMPCSLVCKKRADKDKCNTECEENHKRAIERWNEMIKRQRVTAKKFETSADSDLRLVPCSQVCLSRDDKEACYKECKENQQRAIDKWNEMIKGRSTARD